MNLSKIRSVSIARRQRFRARYGPWAVVTGASDGIGREIALRAAESGLNLALVARRRERLEELASAIISRNQVETRVISADFANSSGAVAVQSGTQDLDVGLLVAAAGFGTAGPFVRADLATESEMLEVNCRAVLALSLHFAKRFAERGRGGIVLMSSLLGFQGVPQAAQYAATKAYIQSFSEALHSELAPIGVDVIASAPGPVNSGFADRAGMRMGVTLRPAAVAQATLNALGRRRTVVPGFLSKILTYSLLPLPRWSRVQIMGLIMGGMTRHLRESC